MRGLPALRLLVKLFACAASVLVIAVVAGLWLMTEPEHGGVSLTTRLSAAPLQPTQARNVLVQIASRAIPVLFRKIDLTRSASVLNRNSSSGSLGDLLSLIALVRPDETQPKMTHALTSPNLNAIVVTFDEPVISTAVTFSLSGGITMESAEQATETIIVVRLAAALTPHTSYVLTVNGLTELSGAAVAPPFNTITFTSGTAPMFPSPPQIKIPRFTTFERYDLAVLSTVQNRIDNGPPPEVYTLLNHFEQQVNQADNYCSVKHGWFVPPTTGRYVFFIATMFAGRLYLSTDADPSNKKLVASEPNYSLNREWTSSLGNSSLAAKRSDKFSGTEWPGGNTIVLLADQPYYIEERQDGGGGGDNGAATFKFSTEPDPLNGSESRITGSAIFTYADLFPLPPLISKAPVGGNFNKGDNLTLAVEVASFAPSFQWYKNKKPIPGATSSSFVITNANATACGDYSVRITNPNGSADTFQSDDTARLIMNGATLNIEAEDFNYGGGQTLPIASVAPYAGGAFKGLKGALDVDFMNNGDDAQSSAFAYNRFDQFDPAVAEMKGPADPPDYNRGSWNVTVNYAIGWNAPFYWQNYTRTLPSGYYNIFTGAARDGLDGLNRLDGSATGNPSVNMVLSKVANPSIPDESTPTTEGAAQGLTKLGSFTSPGTGAWSSNDLIPLTDQAGNIAEVHLGGTVTLRLTSGGDQDADFLLLYLVRPEETPFLLEANRNGNQLVITWAQGGTLEYTDEFAGTNTIWVSTGNSDGSYTSSIDLARRFYRLKR
jgi:hypothetical protein